MDTCRAIVDISKDCVGHEKRRGFQPPWYTVRVLRCPACGGKRYLRVSWRGTAPTGGIVCGAVIGQ